MHLCQYRHKPSVETNSSITQVWRTKRDYRSAVVRGRTVTSETGASISRQVDVGALIVG